MCPSANVSEVSFQCKHTARSIMFVLGQSIHLNYNYLLIIHPTTPAQNTKGRSHTHCSLKRPKVLSAHFKRLAVWRVESWSFHPVFVAGRRQSVCALIQSDGCKSLSWPHILWTAPMLDEIAHSITETKPVWVAPLSATRFHGWR